MRCVGTLWICKGWGVDRTGAFIKCMGAGVAGKAEEGWSVGAKDSGRWGCQAIMEFFGECGTGQGCCVVGRWYDVLIFSFGLAVVV